MDLCLDSAGSRHIWKLAACKQVWKVLLMQQSRRIYRTSGLPLFGVDSSSKHNEMAAPRLSKHKAHDLSVRKRREEMKQGPGGQERCTKPIVEGTCLSAL